MRFILLFSLALSSSAYSFTWQDLWLNENQKATGLFQKGDYSTAAETFQDPAWRASASYRAGRFDEAAQGFGSLKNEEGYYNQGNALAKLGEFTQAIEAYDKALALNPKNEDALFNRKLVQSLLEKQEKESSQSKSEKTDKEDQQNKKDQQDKKDQQNQQENASGSNSPQEAKQEAGDSSANKQDPKEGEDSAKNSPKDKGSEQSEEKSSDTKEVSAEVKPSQERSQEDSQKKTQAMASGKKSEKEAENQQWLKLIPDDPGGLLREKFLRDYLRRQGGWQP